MTCCRNFCKPLLWLGLAVLLLYPLVSEAGHRGDLEEVHSLEGSSGVSEYELDVVDSTRRAELRFRPLLEAGRLFVELVGPDGEARAWGQFEAGRPGGSLNWKKEEPARGRWTLKVNREEATGRYRLQWKAR